MKIARTAAADCGANLTCSPAESNIAAATTDEVTVKRPWNTHAGDVHSDCRNVPQINHAI